MISSLSYFTGIAYYFETLHTLPVTERFPFTPANDVGKG